MRIRWMAAVALACATQALAADKMPWANDYKEAVATSAATGKLIMIDFTADW